ncbi:hypothetical protein JI435_408210, partial [Parastagonospora nodorum SN15]
RKYISYLHYRMGRLKYGKQREHEPCVGLSPAYFPSVTCYRPACTYSVRYIGGCCGAYTPVILLLASGLLGSALRILSFCHVDVGSGPSLPFGGGMYSQRFLGG